MNAEKPATVIFVMNAFERLIEMSQGLNPADEDPVEFIMKTLNEGKAPGK